MKIEVYLGEESGTLGIGIRIIDRSANLQDLLDAWQPLCDDTTLYRPYGNGENSACKGCTINCCNTAYVIPDLVAFKKMAEYLSLSHAEFINRYFQTDKVQHGLLRLKPEPCIFLKDNICTIYSVRTLICRFYLCSKLLPDTEQLIYKIAWTGIAATQLYAQEQGLIKNPSRQGLTSFDQLFLNLVEEYRHDPNTLLFKAAEDYRDIPLLPFMKE